MGVTSFYNKSLRDYCSLRGERPTVAAYDDAQPVAQFERGAKHIIRKLVSRPFHFIVTDKGALPGFVPLRIC